MNSQVITYVLIAVVLVIGIYVLVNRFIKKKKQKDSFNKFIKPKVKEQLKKDGYENHAYEVLHRYHHTLNNQNRNGQVDLILSVYNPKTKSIPVKLAYTLKMREVPIDRKDSIWEIDEIGTTTTEAVHLLLEEKEERKKNRVKYFKQDVGNFGKNFKKKGKGVATKVKGIGKKKTPEVVEERPFDPELDKQVDNPFDVLE